VKIFLAGLIFISVAFVGSAIPTDLEIQECAVRIGVPYSFLKVYVEKYNVIIYENFLEIDLNSLDNSIYDNVISANMVFYNKKVKIANERITGFDVDFNSKLPKVVINYTNVENHRVIHKQLYVIFKTEEEQNLINSFKKDIISFIATFKGYKDNIMYFEDAVLVE
jgi:hypothetical protein